jgi:hypothetical protein
VARYVFAGDVHGFVKVSLSECLMTRAGNSTGRLSCEFEIIFPLVR